MQKLLSFFFTNVAFIGIFCSVSVTPAFGASTGVPGSAPTKIPPVTYPSKPPPPPPVPAAPPLVKPPAPAMDKPFGMPGVVGLRDGKWEGTDYLGHLSNKITVDVEILKGDKTPVSVDISSLQAAVKTLLKDEGFTPHAEVTEGPPLPFLHILAIIYPVDKDKYVVFTTCRLFEQIQVVRKDFKPAGYWQGITWENQDISLSTFDQLPAQVKSSIEALLKAFIERYRLYNKEDENRPAK